MLLAFMTMLKLSAHDDREPIHKQVIWMGLFLLSAATLTFEINLTRLFSVAQFYHFAFMIVSVALLGYGASGTALVIFPKLYSGNPESQLGKLSLATGVSILASYLLINWLPFDSYSIFWDAKQVFILILHYIALATPFFFSGMALAILLTGYPSQAGPIYAVNLFGSAAGCLLALLLPGYLGGEGMVSLSSLLAMVAAILTIRIQRSVIFTYILTFGMALFALTDLSLRFSVRMGIPALNLHISPYKSLSYVLQYPDSKVISSQWNAFSRLDVVQSHSIHSLPGLSYRYLEPLPQVDGMLVDGDDLSPIVQYTDDASFLAYLPNAIAFLLHPQAHTLVLEPRGGLDITLTQTLGSGWVSVVEVNPLIIDTIATYADQRPFIQAESERSFLARTEIKFDVILLSLTSSYHPVQSGAYTLVEDYRYTLESFQDMLSHLSAEGLLVTTRWLQDPPSEDLRLFALAVTAIETSGANPRQQIVAFRGYNTVTLVVKNSAFSAEQLHLIRDFTATRAFDLIYAPDIREDETNRYNILPESKYYQTYLSLLEAEPRQAFYDSYPYDVRPPTDDHPFFSHYFKWQQAPQVLAGIGKAWLPFGGVGYFIILALLGMAILLAGALILLPVWFWKVRTRLAAKEASPFLVRNLIYFGLLGFAFLFVEIPLLQRFILYLGNAAYAFTMVLFSLLFFSGFGSRYHKFIPLKAALGAVMLLIFTLPLLLPRLFDATIGLPLAARMSLTVATLAPLGFLMGIPFPSGLQKLLPRLLGNQAQGGDEVTTQRADIPWIWAVNGAASVIAPILASLLALSLNFSVVLWAGGLCYLAALVTAWVSLRQNSGQYPSL